MRNYDHILLIGFGGPEKEADIIPFLKQVTLGRNIPEDRLKLVAEHYQHIGGFSPYNAWAKKLQILLQQECQLHKINLPVYLGMRNWHPFLKDTLQAIQNQKQKKGIGIILAPHKSPPSCHRYKENVKDAQAKLHAEDIEYHYLHEWHLHPLYIEAQAKQILRKIAQIGDENMSGLLPVFTTHSIPLESEASCNHCHYSKSFIQSCELIANKLSFSDWTFAYQSRSGNPREPWLEPDILEKIDSVKKEYTGVLIIPLGFLSDNAEVLYDLDTEAQAKCKEINLKYFRASTIEHESSFIQMLRLLIENQLKRG